jgi:nicotinamide mononucleotide transporter PnuC
MKRFYEKLNYFSNTEKIIWTASVCLIAVSHIVFGGDMLNLLASLIGVTSLLFAAKGNPFGMVLMIVFSLIYGYISYRFTYYGELLTYVGMTLPMSVWSLIQWLRHPYRGNRAQVTVNAKLPKREWLLLAVLAVAVTTLFCFILRALGTANLIPSTLSVTTSFVAVYLTARRSPYYAIAYACNDVVLMILWVLAALTDRSYVNTVICFAAFLAGDIYGFVSWKRMEKAQSEPDETEE